MKKPHKYPKQDNPVARARELQQSWEKLMKEHSKPLFGRPVTKIKDVAAKQELTSVRRQNAAVKTNPLSMMGIAAKAAPKVYTGTKILGIATMHKSNLVPIFNEDAAVEVAQMRRN